MFQDNNEKTPTINDPEQMMKHEEKDTDISEGEQEENLEDNQDGIPLPTLFKQPYSKLASFDDIREDAISHVESCRDYMQQRLYFA